MTSEGPRAHILTVSVEDYFHSGSLDGVVAHKHWSRIESRLDRVIRETLDLLAENKVSATFFVLGWIAERQPEIVRAIREAGHEIASRGYWKGIPPHPTQLREELHRTREALEAAGSNRIYGYRHWRWLTRPEELWILNILIEEGYHYDSSVNPILRRFHLDPRWYEAHQHRHSATQRTLWTFPVSTMNALGWRIPFSGGNYMRQLPHRFISQAVVRWERSRPAPAMFYFFPWEMDSDQPHIQGISTFQRIRHYRRLGKTRHVFAKYFKKYRFQPIGDFLGLPWRTAPVDHPREARPVEISSSSVEVSTSSDALPVTLVVPLYNEEATVPYLRGSLVDLRNRLGRKYKIHLNLVDDGSKDRTWDRLHKLFGDFPDCRILRHEQNAGVAAAILTGIRNAPTEVVASIDCDCSYDPGDLESMIPMIESADLVTASPYHTDGRVFNVPPWRLFLSRTLSGMYSALLGSSLSTYTSCFRVYRKSAVQDLPIRNGGFLGVAEVIIRLRLRGGRIVEYPTILESRLFGESKMKIIRTILSHLGLLRELFVLRLRGGGAAMGPKEEKVPPQNLPARDPGSAPVSASAPVPAEQPGQPHP
jgi:polysaccharide deacetylase family protein (PEP-CTERM system associated)